MKKENLNKIKDAKNLLTFVRADEFEELAKLKKLKEVYDCGIEHARLTDILALLSILIDQISITLMIPCQFNSKQNDINPQTKRKD